MRCDRKKVTCQAEVAIEERGHEVVEFTGERFVPGKPELVNLYQEHMSRYMFSAQFVKGKRVLDLGCGCGYGSYHLAKHGAAQVFGIDNSKEAVEFSRDHYRARNLRFEAGDATTIHFESSSFDVVVAFELIEHLKDYEKMLAEVKLVLRRDGIFVVSTPNKATYETENGFHVREFDYGEFRDILEKHFSYLKIMHQTYPSALAIQGSSKSKDVSQIEITKAPKHAGVLEDSLYFVAVCSVVPLPEIKEYVYLFSDRTLLLENYRSLKKLQREFDERTEWALKLRDEVKAKDARIMELQREFDERTEWALKLRDEVKAKDEEIQRLLAKLSAIERSGARQTGA